MKIGIVTCQYSNNFGAVLQAYGLKTVWKKWGIRFFILEIVQTNMRAGCFFGFVLMEKNIMSYPFLFGRTIVDGNSGKHFSLCEKNFI